MYIMAQNMINKFGQVVSKDRLTHDQSWKWGSGTSVNIRVRKEFSKRHDTDFASDEL